ncbi:lysophospholipid acyltransferase family protein [Gaoshiqia sediminis]|uniref:Lysophospholipid acyltransferase family protein n=1 Tax=Gaoshiqia sediminis TaxID=2986998 RepID=A0AA41Y8D8_9BACT|nr:lysophospholipid acyltransferase family protein [Gaoshiqia sediminis]MCW0483067.1 lysophospholipid acyltransferase family protein [Gaoshiqia sediminis]
MELVNPKDILQASPYLAYLGGENLAKFIMYVLRFNKLNKIYGQIADKHGIEFIDELIKILEIRYEFDPADLKKLPKEGPFIVVANHPFGGLDGILLIKLLAQVRPDTKVLANFLLKRIEPISDFFLAVNPFENRKGASSSIGGIKNAFEHLQAGGGLCIFPAGEVSSYDASNKITDRQWQYPVLKFIKKAGVPVLPVYFGGHNSRLFHLIGRIHPNLRTVKLPSELLNKKKKPVKVRIGSPIPVKEQDNFPEVYQFGRYLRAKTYSLCSSMEVKRFFNYSLKRHPKPEEIVAPVESGILTHEIKNLKAERLLFQLKNFAVYCAPSGEIPNVLNEIGRLREVTFREVGEGTNRSIDLDEFDLYYNQLFIWDVDAQKLVGAYRIGKGDDILHDYGPRGFYVQSLFRLKEGFEPILQQALELGRSFIVKEYQRQPMSLFLLWKGILYFLLKNPEYRYLLGPVSISNNYSKISKELIIRFIMTHHFDWNMARLVAPRRAFKFKSQDANMNVIMENLNDINMLDKFIGDVDELNTGLPVLLKKYIKLNAKIVGFNVDPKFNNCLDGLILLDVMDVPKSTIESLSKEVNDGSILQRFYSSRE